MNFCIGLPEDAPKSGIDSTGLIIRAAKLWASWSREEQDERTEVKYQQMMVDYKAGKTTVQHNTAVSVFNDAQGSIRRLENEVFVLAPYSTINANPRMLDKRSLRADRSRGSDVCGT